MYSHAACEMMQGKVSQTALTSCLFDNILDIEMTYIPRDITDTVKTALHDMPVVVITGMRQSGKSTFLQNQGGLNDRRYVSLDDLNFLAAAKENPVTFVRDSMPITIDEAQRCPELFPAIKQAVDEDRTPGRFILSGSANFLLMKNIGESLAGRAVYFHLHPFTRRELSGRQGTTPFVRRFFEHPGIDDDVTANAITWEDIMTGGMPPICTSTMKNPAVWFKGYEQTYLERDIRDLGRIGDVIAFRTLLHLAALRTGQIFNPSELGRDARLKAATSGTYLSLLEMSCVMYRIPPYFGNRSSRLVKSPKFYMADSGLAAFLTGMGDHAEDLLREALLETYVAQNLMGILESTWPEARMHFWHVQGRHEVDFIIEKGTQCLAIEVKAAGVWNSSDLRGLKSFLNATPSCRAGILAYNGLTAARVDENLWIVPLDVLLS